MIALPGTVAGEEGRRGNNARLVQSDPEKLNVA